MAACCSKLRGNISTEKKVLTGAIQSQERVLAGTIASGDKVLSGAIPSGSRVLFGAVASKEKKLGGTIPGTLEFHYSDAPPEYAGPYEVTPTVSAQTLETAGKLMRDDVEVKAIPFYEVSNTSGGSTVYIAKEIT